MNPFEILADYAFIIIFVLIAFSQWLVTKFRGEREEETFEWPEDDQSDEEADQDPLADIRRRLERRASNRETESSGTQTPPPVPEAEPTDQRRTVSDWKPILQDAAGTMVDRQRRELERKKSQLDSKTEELAASLQKAEKKPEKVYGAKATHESGTGRRQRIRGFLANPESLRDAVLLQEILGTPRSQKLPY